MKQKIIVGALIIVGLASIAYAAFSQSLVIEGTGTTSADWDVKITGIAVTSEDGATQVVGTPSFTATSATFDVELAHPGATATYEIAIANEGNIDALLDSITPDISTINSATPTDLTFSLSGVEEGTTTLNAGATNTATVTVTWNAQSTITSTQTKTATITLNYIQNT